MSGPGTEDAPLHLFLRYPRLEEKFPRVPLMKRPSAVQPLPSLGENIWIKRDDQAAVVYGGNKPRKLEFLLGKAVAAGRKSIVTFGGIGSHHALAVALCGNAFGLETILVAVKQPPTPHTVETLCRIHQAGARVEIVGSTPGAAWAGVRNLLLATRRGRRPLLIMPGGSSALGCIGFVEAALELDAQVREGILPEPDVIVVPVGSMGTVAGLLAGLALTGLRTRILGVVVSDVLPISPRKVLNLARKTLGLLRERDPEVPDVAPDGGRLALTTRWLGAGYGHPTPEGEEAIAVMKSAAGIALEGTYTAKAFAAVLSQRAAGDLVRPVLFWNTFNSLPLGSPPDAGKLPPSLRAVVESSATVPARPDSPVA